MQISDLGLPGPSLTVPGRVVRLTRLMIRDPTLCIGSGVRARSRARFDGGERTDESVRSERPNTLPPPDMTIKGPNLSMTSAAQSDPVQFPENYKYRLGKSSFKPSHLNPPHTLPRYHFFFYVSLSLPSFNASPPHLPLRLHLPRR